MKNILIIASSILILFSSCKKENTTINSKPITKIKLAEVSTTKNEKVTLWSDDSLATGYHKLYLFVSGASGQNSSNATVVLLPIMKMSAMSHSSPVEQPVYNSVSGLYEGAVVFTMPSGTDSWMVNATINDEEKVFNLKIPAAPTRLVGSYSGTDGNKYVVSLIPPKKWEVGLNGIEILINKNVGMMSFPGVNDFEISMMPEMPSMGHGSPNNVNPISTGLGRYKGKVNYTMTGDWRMHFKLTKAGTTIIEDAVIDILF